MGFNGSSSTPGSYLRSTIHVDLLRGGSTLRHVLERLVVAVEGIYGVLVAPNNVLAGVRGAWIYERISW